MRAFCVGLVGLALVGCDGDVEPDAGPADLGILDAGQGLDMGIPDAGTDVGQPDFGSPDTGEPDQGVDGGVDLGPEDAGLPVDPLEGTGTPEVRAGGFGFTEGPVWHAGRLLFSDIPGDRIHALGSEGASVFREPSEHSNGLFARDGALYACLHGSRRVVRITDSGELEVLADAFEGRRLNSPNDLVVAADGTVYFTDPEWGIIDDLNQRELDFNGLFRIDPQGGLHREWSAPWQGHGNTPRPNGVALSPDGRTLYMADDAGARVLVFDVADDGSLGERSTWSVAPTPDGLTVDVAGNLYVATAQGVEVYSPAGDRWGAVSLASPSNVSFGGNGRRTLFVTAGAELLSVGMRVPGLDL